jgi:hypothetical protein
MGKVNMIRIIPCFKNENAGGEVKNVQREFYKCKLFTLPAIIVKKSG